MEDLIYKLAKKEMPTDQEIENALYIICDEVHSGCDYRCPVYNLFDTIPASLNNRFDCVCFKNGKKMLELIREQL